MHLTKLEVQGFKTFAKKVTLAFPGPKGSVNALTSIVGPNGSGKSNLADAIRWALGEQSLKVLRGKDSEDVIFAGAEGKTRSGFAEVSLTFNNEDHAMPIEFSEVTLTRRLYRDGTSEYLLNNAATRLQDLQLLLAQANVGQRSYSVIAQGMIDHVLVASPEERKAFFDDATGVKQFQLKRHQAILKLRATYENLEEVETILRELEPRMRSLKRQVSRLEQREEIEKELRELQHAYYGSLWSALLQQESHARDSLKKMDEQVQGARRVMESLESKMEGLVKTEVSEGGSNELQNDYRKLQRERTQLRDAEFAIQKEIELEKVRAQSRWAPLPLPKIIDEVKALTKNHNDLVAKIKTITSVEGLSALTTLADELHDRSRGLLLKLERPAPETIKSDEKLLLKLEETRKSLAEKEETLKRLEAEIDAAASASRKERTELFDIQKELREKQTALYGLEQARNGLNIELARLEERRAGLSREIDEELKEQSVALKASAANTPAASVNTEAVYPEIQKLKYKLELIGGIDQETIKEYEETKTRFEFLDVQITDLRKAIQDTEKIIDELDEKIREQSETQFKEINREFQRYFKGLFGGGSCSLVQMTLKESESAKDEDKHVGLDHVMSETGEAVREAQDQESLEAIKERVKERQDRIVGIEIQATPPGKKLKALNLLSGGERALTSIALLSAIMATNPSPFVVLDEVDAALDESNTVRFAAILDELRKLTQFIVITHNRATMERADIIYGVTMGDDGVSNLLSVNLEEVAKGGTARR